MILSDSKSENETKQREGLLADKVVLTANGRYSPIGQLGVAGCVALVLRIALLLLLVSNSQYKLIGATGAGISSYFNL